VIVIDGEFELSRKYRLNEKDMKELREEGFGARGMNNSPQVPGNKGNTPFF